MSTLAVQLSREVDGVEACMKPPATQTNSPDADWRLKASMTTSFRFPAIVLQTPLSWFTVCTIGRLSSGCTWHCMVITSPVHISYMSAIAWSFVTHSMASSTAATVSVVAR